MAIHWTIPFKSLRSGTLYTVNIYDSTYSGNPIPLKGGAQPFTTQEDNSDDLYEPVRTQSGYLRIVDDGKDANGNAFNWKNMLPMTDTDRPVTLTDESNNVVWQGFMQAQNFGGVLYGNPQEREYPIQCALTILEGTDINYTQKQIQNFAYLLKQIVDAIPSISIDTIVIQGGADAQEWLLKCIDWQNFVNEDNDGTLTARYNLFQCLEDMCRFWGWTARTYRKTMYLVRPDDSSEQTFLTLTTSQLTTMAGGIAAGNTTGTFSSYTMAGDIFTSINNDDYRQRGPNKATVSVNGNAGEEKVIDYIDDTVVDEMEEGGWQNPIHYNDKYVTYTNDITTIDRPLISGISSASDATFNEAAIKDTLSSSPSYYNMIRILKTYNGDTFASLYTKYEHLYDDGALVLHANIYRFTDKFTDVESHEGATPVDMGNKTMYVKIGIGPTRATAKWYNGNSWSSTETTCKMSIGNNGDTLYALSGSGNFARTNIPVNELKGILYIDFLGSDDLPDIDDKKTFEIEDFNVVFYRSKGRAIGDSGRREYVKADRSDHREYISTNGNNVREEWNADCIYASDNVMDFGYGVLINPDDTYMVTAPYGSSNLVPEQQLADRVTTYWATAKRKITSEFRSNAIFTGSGGVEDINPQSKVTLDGTLFYPIAFGREWRDDVTIITMLEMPTV